MHPSDNEAGRGASGPRTMHGKDQGGVILSLTLPPADAARIGDLAALRWGWTVSETRRPCGTAVVLDLYFENRVEAELAARVLPPEAARSCTLRAYGPEDWSESWKRHFPALDIGKRLRIVPPWLAPRGPDPDGRVSVVINPGLSFGTGHHFTTRFCLEQLDRRVPGLPGGSLLDIGTGSGILAIAAVRLGLHQAVGVDNDPVCIEQARENAGANGVASRTVFREQDLAAGWPAGRFDLVCANVYSRLLIEHAQDLLGSTGCFLLMTGIRVQDLAEVEAAYAGIGGRVQTRAQDAEWAGLAIAPPPP